MIIRRAQSHDVPPIVAIYRADGLTGSRELTEEPLAGCYLEAFHAIDADPNQALLVAELDGAIVGTLQLIFIQHLISRAFRRAVVEAMFVHPDHQGRGVGTTLIQAAVEAARGAKCAALELTSNHARLKAHRFYAKLGFQASHQGFKLSLKDV